MAIDNAIIVATPVEEDKATCELSSTAPDADAKALTVWRLRPSCPDHASTCGGRSTYIMVLQDEVSFEPAVHRLPY